MKRGILNEMGEFDIFLREGEHVAIRIIMIFFVGDAMWTEFLLTCPNSNCRISSGKSDHLLWIRLLAMTTFHEICPFLYT